MTTEFEPTAVPDISELRVLTVDEIDGVGGGLFCIGTMAKAMATVAILTLICGN